MARHLMRLQLARGRIDAGATAEVAMKALRPPVFFKAAGPFRNQLRQWNSARLAQALALVLEAEQQCKQTGMPVESLCGRAILQISRLGVMRQHR